MPKNRQVRYSNGSHVPISIWVWNCCQAVARNIPRAAPQPPCLRKEGHFENHDSAQCSRALVFAAVVHLLINFRCHKFTWRSIEVEDKVVYKIHLPSLPECGVYGWRSEWMIMDLSNKSVHSNSWLPNGIEHFTPTPSPEPNAEILFYSNLSKYSPPVRQPIGSKGEPPQFTGCDLTRSGRRASLRQVTFAWKDYSVKPSDLLLEAIQGRHGKCASTITGSSNTHCENKDDSE